MQKATHCFLDCLLTNYSMTDSYSTESDNFLPGLNFTTVFAGMLISFPVLGLRPVLADLLDTEKVPNPIRVTLSPPFNALPTESKTASKAAPACALVKFADSATWLIKSPLFIFV